MDLNNDPLTHTSLLGVHPLMGSFGHQSAHDGIDMPTSGVTLSDLLKRRFPAAPGATPSPDQQQGLLARLFGHSQGVGQSSDSDHQGLLSKLFGHQSPSSQSQDQGLLTKLFGSQSAPGQPQAQQGLLSHLFGQHGQQQGPQGPGQGQASGLSGLTGLPPKTGPGVFPPAPGAAPGQPSDTGGLLSRLLGGL